VYVFVCALVVLCIPVTDMLEVGCKNGPGGPDDPGLSSVEARTHFGAWCIVSSPLILSHDVNDDAVTDEIWPIIANTEAIAINQAWAGESGECQLSVTRIDTTLSSYYL
jgi:alpha-galactosidase